MLRIKDIVPAQGKIDGIIDRATDEGDAVEECF